LIPQAFVRLLTKVRFQLCGVPILLQYISLKE
jgi:hypothetical protein